MNKTIRAKNYHISLISNNQALKSNSIRTIIFKSKKICFNSAIQPVTILLQMSMIRNIILRITQIRMKINLNK